MEECSQKTMGKKNSLQTPIPITGNYFNKHQSENPVVRFLVNRYRVALQSLVGHISVSSALEIGSGEGYIVSYMQEVEPRVGYVGSDITLDMVREGHVNAPTVDWCVCYGEHLPFATTSFDLVLTCEVLEHVMYPAQVLREIHRVSKRYCLLSVPEEPIWRILNMMRGKYLASWGNTPGHLNHWSKKGIARLVGRYFNLLEVRRVVPWLFILAEKCAISSGQER